MGYWVNFDNVKVTLHTEDCGHVSMWAGEEKSRKSGKWDAFNTRAEATASTRRQIHECRDCNL